MKKLLSIILALTLCLSVLTACGSNKAKDYTNDELIAAINAGGCESTEYNLPVAFDSEDAEIYYNFFDFTKDNYKAGAFSMSLMNVQAYAIAVIQPVEGKGEEVVSEFNTYVEGIQKSFEQYLVDQYEISKNAIVKQLDNGVVVMVMCEDSQTVYENIIKAME